MRHPKKLLIVVSLTGIIALITGSPSCKNSANKKQENSLSPVNNLRDSFRVRALTDIKYERTEKRFAEGKYLVQGILHCFNCHSPHAWDSAGAPPVKGKEGSGGDVMYEDSTTKIIAPNITPDKTTGAGTWTDDMLARAIREGIGHDGRALSYRMPSQNFRHLSDEHLAAVIVYLRSIPAVKNTVAATKISVGEKSWLEKSAEPLTQPVPTPDCSDSLKRGSYLVRLGDCMGCHSFNAEFSPGILGGGYNLHVFGHHAFSANITTDASGIDYGAQGFIFVMRTGKGNTLSPIMPWNAFKNMSEKDLKAIYAYLSTLPKSQHHITNQQPFTHCIICGQEHGNGDKNVITKPPGIILDEDIYEDYAGTYFNQKYNATYTITKQEKKLMGQLAENAPTIELIPQSETYFLAPGWPLPVSFIKDDKGKVTALKEATDYGEVFKKTK